MAFPIVNCCFVQYMKLLRKQGKIISTYIFQLSTVASDCRFNPQNLCREATLATKSIIRTFKVLIYNIKGLYMVLLDTLKYNF